MVDEMLRYYMHGNSQQQIATDFLYNAAVNLHPDAQLRCILHDFQEIVYWYSEGDPMHCFLIGE